MQLVKTPFGTKRNMAATRERRSNAGNRIARLLNEEEEEEDFYKTSYGGFQETEDDNEYVQKKTGDSDDDIVDSDFSIDEDDEVVSDNEDAPKRRPRTLATRAYKEPPKKAPVAKKSPQKVAKSPIKKRSPQKPKRAGRSTYTVLDSGKISLRRSTALKSMATEHRVKAYNEARSKRPKSSRVIDTMPTQKELLAEAEITAKENLDSLEKFKQMEIEKKKVRPTKRVNSGPIIRYHSLSMPAMSEIKLIATNEIKLESDDNEENEHDDDAMDIEPTKQAPPQRTNGRTKMNFEASSERVERTFITFENDIEDKFLDTIFNRPRKVRRNEKLQCALTRLPAKYIDPITKLPYRNIQALKIIREAYYQLLEANGSPGTEKWLQWRQKIKESKKND